MSIVKHYDIRTYRQGRNGVVEVVCLDSGDTMLELEGYIGKTGECGYADAWAQCAEYADTLNRSAYLHVYLDSMGLSMADARQKAEAAVYTLTYPRLPLRA